nr:hypothetical protein [Lachnospiraceae bacterium]
MKKIKAIVSVLLSIVMVMGLIPESALEAWQVSADPVTSGEWTDYTEEITFEWEGNSKIYNISKAEQLAWVAAGINDGSLTQAEAKFRLTADIDLSAHYWIPIGATESRVFIAPFDGNGHTISGMRIGSADNPYNGSEFAGLFGYAQINVSDLRITDASIYAQAPRYSLYTGLLVGSAKGTGTIKSCECSGRICTNGPLSASDGPIGGIAGYITGSVTVDSCRTQITVGALSTSRQCYYGGIAGTAGPSVANYIHVMIQNCVSSVTVELPEGMNPEKTSGGAITGYSKSDASCSVRNCFGIADHGGACRSMDLTMYSSGSYVPVPTGAKTNVIIVDQNHKIKEGSTYIAQDNAYTFYGYSDGTGVDPQEMTEAEIKDVDFVEQLNVIAGSIEDFDPLTWEIDANVNGGFPNLPDAKAGEGVFLTVTFVSKG